jgi:two-component system chemotaxis response regulator CheY
MFPLETKILIADDMPTIRDILKSQLRAMGFKNIVEAVDGESALNLLISSREKDSPIQLVISDWNMPRVSGLDLLKQVRASADWKDLPFILLTSESERDHVTEAIVAGVSQYIIKPFTPKLFEEKLQAVWNKVAKK